MTTDSVVRARLDASVKERATKALDAMGLSPSDAIRLLFVRIAEEQRFPFELRAPNAASLEALAELDAGKGHVVNNRKEFWSAIDSENRFLDKVQTRHQARRKASRS
ncbi:MAG: type II toxin-antitoxin system RelB/DinJ family antitoxin [Hyphomicrobiales bacterium]|nr:type II toxin-antitoxin system RelB/DinJ family antitoxin [Hyphomicrobiales bacterium]